MPTYDELVLVARREPARGGSGGDPALHRGAGARHGSRRRAPQRGRSTALLEANPDLEPKLTRAEVAATLPLLDSAASERPYGYMDPARWARFIAWMRDNGLIDSLPAPPSAAQQRLPARRDPRVAQDPAAQQP